MDWLSFLASVLNSLAWPGAIVVSVFILRRALGQLLPGLNRLKYKDLEVHFGKELDEVRRELHSGAKPAIDAGSDEDKPSAETEESYGLAQYYESIAEVSPRAAILEAWIGFETTATSSAQKLELIPPGRPTPMPKLIHALKIGELVSNEEARALTTLRALRNDVVHGPDSHLSAEKAGEYAALLREISDEIASRAWARMPKNC